MWMATWVTVLYESESMRTPYSASGCGYRSRDYRSIPSSVYVWKSQYGNMSSLQSFHSTADTHRAAISILAKHSKDRAVGSCTLTWTCPFVLCTL